ncbi:MAG: hypothetical protein JW882_06360, partial [Deltaproteobacteria bacterium]|nr:hypothetical protein [Deltaproteobacteria bacterium]
GGPCSARMCENRQVMAVKISPDPSLEKRGTDCCPSLEKRGTIADPFRKGGPIAASFRRW